MLSRTATGLCLDDSGVLRGVTLASTLRGIVVVRTGMWRTDPPAGAAACGDAPASWSDLLGRARADGFAGPSLVVGLPSHSTCQKRLSFPFRGRARILSVLRSALDGEIPLSLDRAEADYLALPSPGKGTEALALACPRESVESVIGAFPSPGDRAHSPPVVQTDALGLAAAAVHLGIADGAALWAEGGAALLVRLAGARVAEIRRLRGQGPNDLARQAAAILEDAGSSEGDLLLCGPEADRFAMRTPLREAGVAGVVEREDAPLLRGLEPSDPGAFVPALGLALTGLGRGAAAFDLAPRHRGEEAPGWGWTAPRARLAALGGAVILLAGAWFLTDYLDARRELDAWSSAIRSSYSSLFPGEKLVHDTETAQLRVRIRALEQKVRDYTSGAGEGADPLRVMGELSKAAPADLDLKLEELAVEPGRLRLDGSLPAFDAIDRFKLQLDSSAIFTGVKVQNARVGANAGRVSFRLQAEVK